MNCKILICVLLSIICAIISEIQAMPQAVMVSKKAIDYGLLYEKQEIYLIIFIIVLAIFVIVYIFVIRRFFFLSQTQIYSETHKFTHPISKPQQ